MLDFRPRSGLRILRFTDLYRIMRISAVHVFEPPAQVIVVRVRRLGRTRRAPVQKEAAVGEADDGRVGRVERREFLRPQPAIGVSNPEGRKGRVVRVHLRVTIFMTRVEAL